MKATSRHIPSGITFVLFSTILFVCAKGDASAEPRHKQDLPNYFVINQKFSRSGRPTAAGLNQLKQQGFKTIIDLEDDARAVDREHADALSLGLNFISSPMNANVTPSDQQIKNILSIVQNKKMQPVLIHCLRGKDRTGLVVGLYRYAVNHWNAARAYDEMLADGFHPQYQALDDYFRAKTAVPAWSQNTKFQSHP